VRSFPAELASVSAARHFVRDVVEALPSDVADSVELMVSELATNSVKHADTPFELVVEHVGSHVRVEVTDGGAGQPLPRDPVPSDPSGRGLRIVDLMADKWGVRRSGETKTVWFLVHTGLAPGGHQGITGEAAPASSA
jgi:anti-sigma regulatory factor (Ser/Thr protein kinase)